jgi:UTP--glucose-1-phosphate uridylyltransferase
VRMLSTGGGYAMLEELSFTETNTSFFYTRQSVPRGLGDAVARAEDFVGNDAFCVALGDSIIKSADGSSLLQTVIEDHLQSGADCTTVVEEVEAEEVSRYGVVKPVAGADTSVAFDLEDLVEKPRPEAAPSRLAIAARYVFSPLVFEAIRRTAPDRNGELQLTDAIRLLLQLGKRVRAVRLRPGERRFDIGNFESYFKAFIEFALADDKYGYLVRQYLKRKAHEF